MIIESDVILCENYQQTTIAHIIALESKLKAAVEKLVVSEEEKTARRETQLLTETLRNQLIKDGLIDERPFDFVRQIIELEQKLANSVPWEVLRKNCKHKPWGGCWKEMKACTKATCPLVPKA
jgi:hypothetical protein